MAIKKKKTKKSSLLYNVKTSEDKTKRNLNEEKFLLKPSFKKEKTKVAYHQTLQNIRASDKGAHIRYMITQT